MAKTALGYRAEVVGSLLRPEYLKEAFDRFDRDEIGEDELVETQDRAALEAITLQEGCGVDVITDGEVRRKFWFDPLTASLSGYNPEVPAPVPFTRGTDEPSGPPPMLPAVTDTLGMRQNLPLREYSFLSQHAHHRTEAGGTRRNRVIARERVEDDRPHQQQQTGGAKYGLPAK